MRRIVAALLVLLAAPSWAMEHYIDSVRHRLGYALPGVSITVYLAGTTTLATIYSDNGATTKGNPFVSNDDGSYEFYAANNAYDLRFSRSGTNFQTPNSIFNRVVLYDKADDTGGGGGGGSGTIKGTVGAEVGIVPVSADTGGVTLTPSTCKIISGEIFCPTGFTITGMSGIGLIDWQMGTAPAAPADSGYATSFFSNTTERWGSIAFGGTAKDYVTTADTQTLTNKTIDCEATGNVCTDVKRLSLRAARCNGSTAELGDFELPGTGAAALACYGTNTKQGVLDFVDSAVTTAQYHWKLPATWTGVIDVKFDWFSSTTSGNVVFTTRTSCSGPSESSDPGWGSTNTLLDATQGTTNNQNDISKVAIPTVGCVAGEWMHLEIGRDGNHASDTMTGTARVQGVELTYREAN